MNLPAGGRAFPLVVDEDGVHANKRETGKHAD